MVFRILNKLYREIMWIKNFFTFKKIGKRSYLISPLRIDGSKNIEIGNNVLIQYKTWLASIPLTGCGKSLLTIGDNCRIGNFNHIYCTSSIVIEDNVLTADKVYISDNMHDYQNVSIPILKQPIVQLKGVTIGSGAWIGENVCIIGSNIGKNCVIGANSVVTHDIPDYCVAVGVPAKVIRIFNFMENSWINV